MERNRFKEEVLPLKNKLYRFAYSLLGDREEGQDAVQDVFIKLWNIRDKLNELNSIEAFAMKVTKNHCLDIIKSRRTVSFEETKSLLFLQNEDDSIEKSAELKDTANHIKQMMSFLPVQQKMIMQLRDIEGYEFDEIERALGISINTIRVNLSRARKKIRELYIKSLNNGSEKSKSFIG